MYSNKKQQGFSLIEMLLVIMLVAVIAVTALPRLVHMSSDARISVLQGVEATLISSLNNLRAVCELYQECRDMPTWPNRDVYIPAYQQTLHMIGGFPEAGTLSRPGEIHDFIDTADLQVTNPDTTKTRWAFPDTDDCYVQYKQIGSGETFPVIDVITTGC